jgi:hypothetical protein
MASGTAPRQRTSNRKNVTAVPEPSRSRHDEIARRAFDIFISRGGNHGHDVDDWLKAEAEVNARASGESPAVNVSRRSRGNGAARTRGTRRQSS